MLIVSDHDVLGAVTVIRRILESEEWADYADAFEIRFTDFAALGLAEDSSDRLVWLACQEAGAVLITGNRAGGGNSLDATIGELCDESSLPVVTISTSQRVMTDRRYAEACVLRLLNYADSLDNLLGTGRLFIP